MIKEIKKMFNRWNEDELIITPDKYRLVPDDRGTYTLEEWNPNYDKYYFVDIWVKDEAEAKKIIKNLEKPNIKISIGEGCNDDEKYRESLASLYLSFKRKRG